MNTGRASRALQCDRKEGLRWRHVDGARAFKARCRVCYNDRRTVLFTCYQRTWRDVQRGEDGVDGGGKAAAQLSIGTATRKLEGL